jgi:DNA-binding Xre family transcriptional regulator
MKTRINELRGRAADQGKRVTWKELSTVLGIRELTLVALSKGELRQLRPEYIDALCSYFSDLLGETIGPGDLLIAERVALPLKLNIRPDRRGKRVGED